MKRWQHPTQKGTELFPVVVQSPTKLVIEGVTPGTSLAHALLHRFEGQLKQFHGKCQQNYALTPANQLRQHIEWQGARATYLNVNGHETIRIKVDQPIIDQVQLEIEDWWDWALIDIHIPHTNTEELGGCWFQAARTIPASTEDGVREWVYGEGLYIDEVGDYVFDDGLLEPVLAYPNLNRNPEDYIGYETVSEDVTQVSSLRVDLRRFPRTQVVIEIWGYAWADPIPEEVVAYYWRNVAADSTDVEYFDHGDVDYPVGWEIGMGNENKMVYTHLGFEVTPFDVFFTPQLAYVPGFFSGETEAEWVPIPAPTLTTISRGVTNPSSPGAGSHTQGAVYHSPSGLIMQLEDWIYNNFGYPSPPSGPNAYTIKQTYHWDIHTEYTTVYTQQQVTASGDVRVSAGKGWPPWRESRVEAPRWPWSRWEWQGSYPQHLSTWVANDVIVPPFDAEDDSEITAGSSFLGVVIIDPVKKSISFNRA